MLLSGALSAGRVHYFDPWGCALEAILNAASDFADPICDSLKGPSASSDTSPLPFNECL